MRVRTLLPLVGVLALTACQDEKKAAPPPPPPPASTTQPATPATPSTVPGQTNPAAKPAGQ